MPARDTQPSWFSRLIDRITDLLGNPFAVALAVTLVVAWLAFGPLVGFTDTYQLIINTTTSVITFRQCRCCVWQLEL